MPGPFRGALRSLMTGGSNGSVQSMTGSGNWIYIVVIVVLLVIGIVLIALTIREYTLLKKKQPGIGDSHGEPGRKIDNGYVDTESVVRSCRAAGGLY